MTFLSKKHHCEVLSKTFNQPGLFQRRRCYPFALFFMHTHIHPLTQTHTHTHCYNRVSDSGPNGLLSQNWRGPDNISMNASLCACLCSWIHTSVCVCLCVCGLIKAPFIMRLADLFRWCFLGQHLIQFDMRTLAKTRRAGKEGQKEEDEIKSFRRKERKAVLGSN